MFDQSDNTTTTINKYGKEDEWDPKVKWRQKNGTMGSPKGSNSYGDGRIVVLEQNHNGGFRKETLIRYQKQEGSRLYSTKRGESSLEYTGLQELGKLRNENNLKELGEIYHHMLDYDLHVTAYEKIRTKKGSRTAGVRNITPHCKCEDNIRKTIQSLKDHSFKFKPARRENIPKANGRAKALGIPSPRDKIVLQVMVMILESIWDSDKPIFQDCSHGFRKNKGTHTALKEISQWKGIEWFVEGDIKSHEEAMPPHLLENILRSRITDRQFQDLYWKAVKAGYVEVKEGKKREAIVGTPQGSILSQFLSNLYIHQFDVWMKKKCEESKGQGETSSPKKKDLQLRKIKNVEMKKGQSLKSEEVQSIGPVGCEERRKQKARLKQDGYRIYYTRYADDFQIGVNGTKKIATQVKEEVNKYLEKELKQTLSREKTKISSAKEERIIFLGAEIYRPNNRTGENKQVKTQIGNRRTIQRKAATGLRLNIPVRRIIERLANHNFCVIKDYKQGKIIPVGKTAWQNLSLYDIVQKYKQVLSGIKNYYSFSRNRQRIQVIQNILQHSCAKLIARKLKLNSRAKVFKQYGNSLKIKEGKLGDHQQGGVVSPHKPINRFQICPPDPFEVVNNNKRSRSQIEKVCRICSSTEKV